MTREEKTTIFCYEENLRRRLLLSALVASGISPAFPSHGKTKSKNPYDEKRLLEQNKRIQRENSAPEDFPNFVREGLLLFYNCALFFYVFFSSSIKAYWIICVWSDTGFTVKVVTSDNYVKRDSGLILWDIAVGKGDSPKAGQQVFLLFYFYLKKLVCFHVIWGGLW